MLQLNYFSPRKDSKEGQAARQVRQQRRSDSDFGQAHKRGRVKPVNVIPTLILLIIGRTKMFYFYL
jgi:hypothetical protein